MRPLVGKPIFCLIKGGGGGGGGARAKKERKKERKAKEARSDLFFLTDLIPNLMLLFCQSL